MATPIFITTCSVSLRRKAGKRSFLSDGAAEEPQEKDRTAENAEGNVDTSNRLICYDILELGEQLRAIGMLVILDSILNRITENRQKGKQTFVFIDEIYILFMHEYSAQFLYKLWKRVRKYGAYCTGITQNVLDLLQSHTARTMLSNSEFIVMLNQAATDRKLRVHRHAEPGGNRPDRAGPTAEHL